jgi:pimeloyl-ACP methyl ester carboxylesterase
MYEPLFIRLADAFHPVAPDYPAFGQSDAPVPAAFGYTFDHIAHIIDRFTEPMHIDRYSLFMQGLRRGLSGSAWRWRTPTGSQRWWSSRRWLTEDGLGPL